MSLYVTLSERESLMIGPEIEISAEVTHYRGQRKIKVSVQQCPAHLRIVPLRKVPAGAVQDPGSTYWHRSVDHRQPPDDAIVDSMEKGDG